MKSVCSRIFHLYRVGDYTAYENIQRDFEVKYIVLFMDDNILRERGYFVLLGYENMGYVGEKTEERTSLDVERTALFCEGVLLLVPFLQLFLLAFMYLRPARLVCF